MPLFCSWWTRIKLRAKVAGDDALSKEFLAATNRVGLAFNYDSLQLSDYRISCVGTALKLYNEMGEKIYCESLRLIVVAWDGKPDSFRASVLRGMMHFVELYHGEFSEERLVRALGSVHPMEIYRVGRDNPAKLPGSSSRKYLKKLRNCGMPAAEKRVRTQIRTVLMLCFVVKCSVPTAAIV